MKKQMGRKAAERRAEGSEGRGAMHPGALGKVVGLTVIDAIRHLSCIHLITVLITSITLLYSIPMCGGTITCGKYPFWFEWVSPQRRSSHSTA